MPQTPLEHCTKRTNSAGERYVVAERDRCCNPIGTASRSIVGRDGAPDTTRTCGLHLRRVALYPAELRVHLSFA